MGLFGVTGSMRTNPPSTDTRTRRSLPLLAGVQPTNTDGSISVLLKATTATHAAPRRPFRRELRYLVLMQGASVHEVQGKREHARACLLCNGHDVGRPWRRAHHTIPSNHTTNSHAPPEVPCVPAWQPDSATETRGGVSSVLGLVGYRPRAGGPGQRALRKPWVSSGASPTGS